MVENTVVENGIEENIEMEETLVVTDKDVLVTKAAVYGFGAGISLAGAAGAAAWIRERNKRKALLKQIQHVVNSTKALMNDPESKEVLDTNGKKEKSVPIEISVTDTKAYIIGIKHELSKVKISKKEKEAWNEVMEQLIEMTLAVHKGSYEEEYLDNEEK